VIFRRRERPRWTRIFFATDIHGSTDCFRKFLAAGEKYEADVIVMGGDITGKMLVPIIEGEDGSSRCEFLGIERSYRPEQVADLEIAITRSGLYPYRIDEERFSAIKGNPVAVEEVTHQLVLDRVAEWVEMADSKLAGKSMRVLIGGGNDDYFDIDPILDSSRVMTNHQQRVVEIDEDHVLAGLGYANETPWECPRDISEAELWAKIEELVAGLGGELANAVFCFHVPPKDSQLDICPELDTSLDPPQVEMTPSGPKMFGAGSQAVRDAIEKWQPVLGLHGHIHESRAVTEIGRTIALNPGSEYADGVLRGAIVNLGKDEVVSYQFTSG
jgi:Icc-related predicted phosphoesterase